MQIPDESNTSGSKTSSKVNLHEGKIQLKLDMESEIIRDKNNIMHLYSKQITDENISDIKIFRKTEKDNIKKIVDSFREISKCQDFEDLGLSRNRKKWIKDLLFQISTDFKTTIELLINDFTDSMKTRMREKDKYVLSIFSTDYIMLCHSKGKENTITPDWKVVERMLDRDNVERFVIFIRYEESIRVYYYEHYPSESFTEWLKIPEKDAFYYLGGKNRFYVELAGVHCALELKDEEIEDFILSENPIFRVEQNQIYLDKPIKMLQINSIRVGKRHFASMSDFMQIYLARRYELKYYQDEYQKLVSSLDPLLISYIDDEDKIVKVASDKEKTYLKKRNDNFYIIFANEKNDRPIIQLREGFVSKIYTNFVNDRRIQIFHAGMRLSPTPVLIKSMHIFNKLEMNKLIQDLIIYYESITIKDALIDKALCYCIFKLLYVENIMKPISLFFKEFLRQLDNERIIPTRITQNENSIIEYKSRDFISGSDDDVIQRISDDLNKKMKKDNFKIYFFGVDEESLEVESVNIKRLNSDRVGNMERKVRSQTGLKDLSMIRVPLTSGSILLMIARKV